MKHGISIIGLSLAVLVAVPAHAAVFLQGDTVSMTAPVGSNLYAAGGTVSVQQPVTGDLLAAGGNIRVQGIIGNTLHAAGGQVTVLSPVRRSARLAGGTVSVSAPVGGDLIIAGGQVSVESGAVIDGDMVVFGGTVTMAGRVKGQLKAYGGQIMLDGRVDGPAEINAENVTLNGTIGGETTLAAQTLVLGANASLLKNVRYWTKAGQTDFGMAMEKGDGTAVYDASLARMAESRAYETAKGTGAAIAAVFGLYSLLSSALILLLLLLLGKTFFSRAGERLQTAPWKSLLIGFLYFAAAPALILLLLVSIIGIPVAFLALCVYIFSWIFGSAIAAIVLARWIELSYARTWGWGAFFGVSLLVLVGFKMLALVPVLGWMTRGVFLCMAFGAVIFAIAAAWNRGSSFGPEHDA